MPVHTRHTYCRICEAHCGLVVDVDDQEQVRRVHPDKQHPISKGYSCVKGLGIGALHHDEDRLDYPMKRVGKTWQRIDWSTAIREIGDKVRRLRAQHGLRSVGLYTGNPTYFSFQNILYSSAFLESLHSPNLFASHSTDNNNKLHVSTSMYGRSMVHPVPDLAHTQFFMCFGSNPMVSQMSIIQLPNALQHLQAIEERGGRVIIVDPRRTETAHRVGEHVAIRPGTDAYFLLAMLHVIVHEDGLDLSALEAVARDLNRFTEVARPWTPERVASITDVPAEQIRALARAYQRADGAALYMSTGVNQGPFGSIAYWLIQGLNLITGNTDRRGGLLIPRGAFNALKLAEIIGLGAFDDYRTLVGNHHRVAGCFPIASLAGEIDNDHPERIRALFISAGNPVHSLPGGDALAQAMKRLELRVCIDIYPNETSAEADYLLPATDMLERSDFPVSHTLLQTIPHAQFTEPVVAPKHERRPEWRIFSDLAVACGAKPWGKSVCNIIAHANRWLPKLPGKREVTPDHVLDLLLAWGGQVRLKDLRQNPSGVLLEPNAPHTFLGKRVPTPDGRVNLAPAELLSDLTRLEETASHYQKDTLVLIGRRERKSHNSWMHNNPRIRQPNGNVLSIHPDDAKTRGIEPGDTVEISTTQATLHFPAHITEDVRPGVVVVPHGWGHENAALSRASHLPGANINTLIPGGAQHMEPVSGQAIMMAHPVQVKRRANEL